MSSRKLPPAQLRKFRSDVARLKAKGVVSASKDARSAKPTRYMLNKVAANRDLLEGRAQAVHVPKRAIAKEFSENYRTYGKTIVVPIQKGERVRYAPKAKEIEGTYTSTGGEKIKTRHSKKAIRSIDDFPRGPGITYAIPIGAAIHREESIEDMAIFMFPYEHSARPYHNWQKFVIIERRGKQDFEDMDEGY